MNRFAHVRNAAKILCQDEQPFIQRYLEALDEFWVAVDEPSDWPAHLLDQATEIVDQTLPQRLSRRLRSEPIDKATAREVAKKIFALALELELGGYCESTGVGTAASTDEDSRISLQAGELAPDPLSTDHLSEGDEA